MCDIDTILDRLRTHIYLKNIMPEDWFSSFDNLHSGKVLPDVFRRCFSQMNIRISDAEFNLLVNRYSDGYLVNYRHFCDEIEDIFTNKNLEKTPKGTTCNSGKIVSKTLGRMASNEDKSIDELMKKLYHQVKVRGVNLRDSFMDFDKHNNGNVTQSQFSRANPFTDLSARELSLLYKRYSDPVLHDFNYRRLNTDINDYASNQPTDIIRERSPNNSWLPHQEQSFHFKNFDSTPDELMQKFAAHIRRDRIRIHDFFASHDTLNTGRIRVNKFKGVLTLFGFPFTENDLNSLVEEYKVNVNFTEYVKYKDFCKDVESVEESQLSPVKTRALPEARDPRAKRIVDRLKSQVTKFRVNVLPTLQDFDRFGRGYVTPIQFHRGLTTLRLNITNDERDILAREYGEEQGIDIYKFVEDVDPTHAQKRREPKFIGTTKESIENTYGIASNGDKFVTQEIADQMIYQSKKGLQKKNAEAKDINELLHDMHKWAEINSVMFSEFLQSFDVHNFGEIKAENFRSGIQISGYNLDEAEFELIKQAYASRTRDGFIRWREFDNDIKKFTVPIDLEKTPVINPPIRTKACTIKERTVRTVSPTIKAILEDIATFAKKKRICLKDQFSDFDPLNHKKVTANAFTRVLQTIGCYLSRQQIENLVSFYTDPYTKFVDYGLFSADVDNILGKIFGGDEHTSLTTSPFPEYSHEDSEYLVSVRSVPIPAPKIDEIIKKIQSFVYKRRVRLNEFFTGFDTLRRGLITKQKFHTVVGQAELPLTADEIEMCISVYGDEKQKDMFNYRQFMNKVNEVYGPTELNRTPLTKPAINEFTRDPSMITQKLSPSEENYVQYIMRRMSEKVRARRMNIREQFEDYDRIPRKMYITKQQFRQSVARLGLSTDKYELNALCKKYKSTDLDEINYCAFCNDLEMFKQ